MSCVPGLSFLRVGNGEKRMSYTSMGYAFIISPRNMPFRAPRVTGAMPLGTLEKAYDSVLALPCHLPTKGRPSAPLRRSGEAPPVRLYSVSERVSMSARYVPCAQKEGMHQKRENALDGARAHAGDYLLPVYARIWRAILDRSRAIAEAKLVNTHSECANAHQGLTAQMRGILNKAGMALATRVRVTQRYQPNARLEQSYQRHRIDK